MKIDDLYELMGAKPEKISCSANGKFIAFSNSNGHFFFERNGNQLVHKEPRKNMKCYVWRVESDIHFVGDQEAYF